MREFHFSLGSASLQAEIIPMTRLLHPAFTTLLSRPHRRWLCAVLMVFSPLMVLLPLSGCSSEPVHTSTKQKNTAESTIKSDTATTDGHMLSEAERAFLWDVEHLGFVVEQTVFSRLKTSLNDATLDAWEAFLSEDCVSHLPSATSQDQSILTGAAEFLRVSADSPTAQGDKAAFLNWLREQRNSMASCKTSIGLVRLGPANDRDFGGSWKSTWRIRMAGDDSGKPREIVFDVAVDLMEMGQDIVDHQHWISEIRLLDYRNLAATEDFLQEVTSTCGLESPKRYDNWNESLFVPNTGGVYVTDYDNDGHLDVFVDDHRDNGRLYRGNGDGTFEDVTEKAGLEVNDETRLWTLSCWGDFDGDGDEDLISEDHVYENLGSGQFRDVTADSNLPLTPASGYAVGDFNCDGKLDLYVCHTSAYRVGQQQKSRVSWIDDGLGVDNVLYQNVGNWQFKDVTAATNTGGNGSSCFAAVWLHANNDNKPDLFAINEFGRNSLLLSTPNGTFTDGDVDSVFGGFSMGVAAGDFDNDGWTDLYVANMYSKAGNRILANVQLGEYPEDVFRKIEEGTRGSKLYRAVPESAGQSWQVVSANEMHADVGWSYGPAFADLNSDGWLDIYATAGFKSVKRGEPDG